MYPKSDNNEGIDCSGVSVWNSDKDYSVGQRVTYEGGIHKLTSAGWTYLGACSTGGGASKCEGVAEWNSNTNYTTGQKATYQGTLFKFTNSGWKKSWDLLVC